MIFRAFGLLLLLCVVPNQAGAVVGGRSAPGQDPDSWHVEILQDAPGHMHRAEADVIARRLRRMSLQGPLGGMQHSATIKDFEKLRVLDRTLRSRSER